MRVLCLDIEGGYGGSSRSLFESVRHLRDKADVEVWCRRDGAVVQRYEALKVDCRVTPGMPHISSLRRLSRNLYAFGRFAMAWPGMASFRQQLAQAARDRFDVVHFNHEGLFLALHDLRARLGNDIAATMHIRTYLPSTLFSRWQYRMIAADADRLAFITENERDRFGELAGREAAGSVIYNIATPQARVAPDPELAADSRFKVAVLSNYAYVRGIDRLIDVAGELAQRGRRDIVFVVAGNMSLPRALPGDLGKIARGNGSLVDYAASRGVEDMFIFLGHVPEPEPALAACDVLAKPTREYNPWGRDIIEAMAFSKPPLSVGTYDRFIEDGVTGVLHAEFDHAGWADEIEALADEPDRRRRMGDAALKRVKTLCDGRARSDELLELWSDAIAMRSS